MRDLAGVALVRQICMVSNLLNLVGLCTHAVMNLAVPMNMLRRFSAAHVSKTRQMVIICQAPRQWVFAG